MKAFVAALIACALAVLALAYVRNKEKQDKLAAERTTTAKASTSNSTKTAEVASGAPEASKPTEPSTEPASTAATAPGTTPAATTAQPKALSVVRPKVVDERLLIVAVEGRAFGRLNYQPAGSAFFANLNGRPVLVLSGANLHGFEDVRFVLFDGTPLPRGRFAAATCRDLIVMEVPAGDWPGVDWPAGENPLARGTELTLRSLTFAEGRPVESSSTAAVVSYEGTHYFLNGASAPAGALVIDGTRGLVGVVSLDPRSALAEPTAGADPNAPAARLVVTCLSQVGPTGIAWNTKSFDSVVSSSRRILDLPRRTSILDRLVAGYPAVALITEDAEFFQLSRDFNLRYAEAASSGNLATMQLAYGRQIEGKLMADLERIASDGPITYQSWAVDEVRKTRSSLNESLLSKRRTVELGIAATSQD